MSEKLDISPKHVAEQLQHLAGEFLKELTGHWPLEMVTSLAVDVLASGAPRVLWKRDGKEAKLLVLGRDMIGALALISGVFAVHRISIVEADIHTLPVRVQVPSRTVFWRPGRRKTTERVFGLLVDYFVTRLPESPDPNGLLDTVAREIERVLTAASESFESVRDELIERFARVIEQQPPPQQRLYPIRVHVENESTPNATLLEVESTDTLGFVFEFANALALLRFNIVRVEVRTEDGTVKDRFWITTAQGEKVTDPQALADLRFAAVLIKQFTHLLPGAPNPARALRQFSELARDVLRWSDWQDRLEDLTSYEVLRTLARVLGVSEFLWEDFLRLQHESLFPLLASRPALEVVRSREELEEQLRKTVYSESSWEDQIAALNRFKDREMFRIDLRYLTGRIDFEHFGFELSDLAEAVVRVAVDLAKEHVRKQQPALEVPDLAVFGLGKLGGRELGFASDIELFCCFDDAAYGSDDLGDAQRLADDVVRTLLKIVRSRREGIFEIDLRLRPYGRQGPLAPALSLCRKYYRPGGGAVQLERLALVKMRPLGGPTDLMESMLELRDSFVYSQVPIDYENIRHLRKRQIEELTDRERMNAKYSPGGLVDVEYFVQARQIEVGARDSYVRVPNTLEAISRLRERGAFEAEFADRLAASYRFLRRLIDALRVVRGNARDLHLPPTEDPEFRYLASRLGYEDARALQESIDEVFGWTARIWDRVPSSKS